MSATGRPLTAHEARRARHRHAREHVCPLRVGAGKPRGGRLDRRWLRVSPIDGITSAHKGRADWETTYYPDIITQPHPTRHEKEGENEHV